MNLDDKVRNVIEAFCNDLQSFTSLDVSNQVKQDGFATSRHRDVAKIVRYLYVDGVMHQNGFTRSLIQVQISSGTMRDAYLYHHQTVSSDDYDKRTQIALPPANTQDQDFVAVPPTPPVVTVPAAAPPIVTITPSNSNRQTRYNKADGRLEVPVEWVRSLDWKDGQSIYVVKDQDIMIIKTFDNLEDGDNILTTTHISCGRLRIPKTAFVLANFQYDANNNHYIELGEDSIFVEDTPPLLSHPVILHTFTF